MLRTRGDRIAEYAACALTVLVFVVLYAPILVSAVFSVVEIRKGVILWETFTFQHYVTLWSNASVVDALVNTAIVAICSAGIASILAVLLALYTEWHGAIARTADAADLPAVPAPADRHGPCPARRLGQRRP